MTSELIIHVISYVAILVICTCIAGLLGRIVSMLRSGMIAVQKGDKTVAVFISEDINETGGNTNDTVSE